MHDVFISYASEDEAQAIAIKSILEDNEVSCWFAPSAIRGAQDFTKVIPPALKESKNFLLLLSASAQKSEWVIKELTLAVERKTPIFVIYLDACEVNDQYGFILINSQRYQQKMDIIGQLECLMKDLWEVQGIGEEYPCILPRHRAVLQTRTVPQVVPQTRTVPQPAPQPRPISQPVRETRSTPVIDQGESDSEGKKCLPLILGIAAALAALAAAVVLLFGGGFSGFKDGEYVIWNPEHEVAMSCDVIHDYYLAGEPVLVQRDAMTAPSSKCVWELDFDGDTFTISRAGQLLGVKPKKNGVGLGGDHIYVEWELDDQGDGLYFIRNKDTQQYLEWYEDKNNWCIHGDTSGDKRVLFLLRIEPVK